MGKKVLTLRHMSDIFVLDKIFSMVKVVFRFELEIMLKYFFPLGQFLVLVAMRFQVKDKEIRGKLCVKASLAFCIIVQWTISILMNIHFLCHF